MSSVSGKSDKLTIYRNQSEIKQLPKPCYSWSWEEHVGERGSQCAYSVAYRLLRAGLIFREADNHRTAQGVSDYLNSKGVELKDIDVDEDEGELVGTQTTLEGEEVADVTRNNTSDDVSAEIEDELALFDSSDYNQQTLDGEDAAERVTDYVIAERWSAEIDSSDVDSENVEQMKLIYESYEDWDYNTRDECSSNNDNSDSEQVTLDSFNRKARFWARQGF